MATTNGTLTPPQAAQTPASPSSLKRKRSEAAQPNGAKDISDKELNSVVEKFQSLLADVYEVLKSYDTKPSILEHNLRSLRDRTSGESIIKRVKSGDIDISSTIARKLQDHAYPTIDALLEDVEAASADLLASIKPSDPYANGTPNRYIPPSLTETRLVTGLLAFKKVLKNIVLREVNRQSMMKKTEPITDADEAEKKPPVNGAPESKSPAAMDSGIKEGKTVLTLFANASGPRMLFSSLQQPTHVKQPSAIQMDTSVDVTLPIQESTLPNIISATKVVPIHVEETKQDKKRVSTFGDVFAPPATIPQLSPPKPAKSLTTRGSSVTWVPPESIVKPSRNGFVYSKQTLTTGQWLGYSGVDSPKDPVTAEAKQKHRQRALSTGEANPPLSEAIVAAINQAKEDALFRSAYSSFAPTHDDAIAIVPTETRNQLWWHKVGSKKYVETFTVDPALLDQQNSETSQSNDVDEDTEEKAFAEAVESFDPEDIPNPFSAGEAKDEKETNEILREISELLETLHSYQRIRNSSLTTSSRTPVVQNASLAQLNGTPSNPSSAELDTYNLLKSQLSLMIKMLPPYAVAKLNGDQLADLNISRNLVIETKDYRGVMEEDPITRLTKANAISASAASLSRTPGSHQPYGTPNNQYGRSVPGTHAPSTRQPSTYYPHQQAPVRSPSLQFNQIRNQPAYQTPGGYGAAGPRQAYAAQQSYGQQTPRPAYAQQPPNSSYYQSQRNPAQGYGMPSTYYPQTPQTAPQNRGYPPQGPHPSYTQSSRPAGNPANFNYNYSNAAQSPHVRTVSPLKPGAMPVSQTTPGGPHSQYQQPPPPGGYTAPMIGQPPRSASSTSGQGVPAGYGYGGRAAAPSGAPYGGASHPSTYTTPGSQPPQPGTPGLASAVGPSGFHTSMTNAEQQSMLDRQRAALNLTPGNVPTRTATPGTPITVGQTGQTGVRQGSGTPQPGLPGQGQVQSGQVNGTAGA